MPLALALGLALGLVWASEGGGALPRYSRRARASSWGPWGGGVWFGGFGGGVLSPLVLLLLLLLVVSPPPSSTLTPPLRCGSMPPPTPARPPPTRLAQHGEGQVGVIPQHPAQLGDPHEVRPASAIAPLPPHPAVVGSTRLHADTMRTETRGRCVLAAFQATVLAMF